MSDNFQNEVEMQPEYDFSEAQLDREQMRRRRIYALERLPDNPERLERLRTDPDRATALLRWALDEAAIDARALRLAARAVILARGNLNGLGLSVAELEAMVQSLVEHNEQLPQAA